MLLGWGKEVRGDLWLVGYAGEWGCEGDPAPSLLLKMTTPAFTDFIWIKALLSQNYFIHHFRKKKNEDASAGIDGLDEWMDGHVADT